MSRGVKGGRGRVRGWGMGRGGGLLLPPRSVSTPAARSGSKSSGACVTTCSRGLTSRPGPDPLPGPTVMVGPTFQGPCSASLSERDPLLPSPCAWHNNTIRPRQSESLVILRSHVQPYSTVLYYISYTSGRPPGPSRAPIQDEINAV